MYILIFASFFFYAYTSPLLLFLLIFSPAVNILCSYYITYGSRFSKKTIAVAGVASELAVLAFFKYSPLFAKTFLPEPNSLGEFLMLIPLPIGISFFTFEGISLVLDVYSEKYFDRKKYVSVSLWEHAKNIYCFISFFPHLIAGPIVKAHDFLPQIKNKELRQVDWNKAFKLIVTGYFLKMVVADNLKDFTFWIAFPYFQGHSSTTLIFMLFGYSCQIFSDFAGYSLIAMGLAKLFGYELMKNFNYPYIASSFKDFWKRWHISLSSYLMEYLYIPLGGNKRGRLRTYLNLLVTMFLGGLWHGAAWSYAVWGTFHGLALATERFLSDKVDIGNGICATFLKRTVVFSFVTFAWLLFKLPKFEHVVAYVKAILNNTHLSYDWTICSNITVYAVPVFAYHMLYLVGQYHRVQALKKYEFLIYGLMIFLILTNSGSSGTFIYFQF